MTDKTQDKDTVPSYAAGFWEAVDRGVLAYQHCNACGSLQLYPRRRCVSCGSDNLNYIDSKGDGVVYTFSSILRNPPSNFVDDIPYTLAVVQIEEGPKMLTQIVDCDPDEIRCDMPVKVKFKTRDGQSLPFFTPSEAGA